MRLELPHQLALLQMTAPPSLILRGGYGSGKTIGGILWIIDRCKRNPVDVKSLVVEPTWKQVKKTLLPKFKKVFAWLGIRANYHATDHTFTLSCGRQIWLESGEKPENMAGFDVGPAWIDEPELQAPEVDDRVGSRARDPDAAIRQVLYTGTPEGMTWLDDKVPFTPTITVATTDNPHNPADYIRRQQDKYRGDPIRMDMYFRGVPRALTGNIYTCMKPEHVRPCANPRAGEIVLGMDFNTNLMCTPVMRQLGSELHIISEVVSERTNTFEHTERVFQHLKAMGLAERHRTRDGNKITGLNGHQLDVWCDASGNAEKTSSTTTDHRIVRDAGFWPCHARGNPAVKDRIEAVQYGFSHDLLFVDGAAAPFCTRALQRHQYERNVRPPRPQKKWGDTEKPLDAATDAIGYPVYGLSPVRGARSAA